MVRAGRPARERNGVPGGTKARSLAVPGLACSRDWTRTSNRPINSRMLCQLSYAGSCGSTLTGRRRGPGVTHGRPGCELGRTSAGEADGLADPALERVDLAVGLLAAGQRAEGGDLGVQAPVLATADDGAHPGAAHLDGLVVDHGGLHPLAERGGEDLDLVRLEDERLVRALPVGPRDREGPGLPVPGAVLDLVPRGALAEPVLAHDDQRVTDDDGVGPVGHRGE